MIADDAPMTDAELLEAGIDVDEEMRGDHERLRLSVLEETRLRRMYVHKTAMEVQRQLRMLDRLIERLENDEVDEGTLMFAAVRSGEAFPFIGNSSSNISVLEDLLKECGPSTVTHLVAVLQARKHRLGAAANPLKAVSNELAIMRKRKLVKKQADGRYAALRKKR